MNQPDPQFRALYDAHVNFVWRNLRRLGVRESDLMDVTQKVFLTAFIKLPEFEGRSLLSSWLFGICTRTASDYRRSAPIRREVATEGDVPPGNATPCSPPHSIEVAGSCLPSCGSQQGRTCGPVACAGKVTIPAYDCDICCGS